jgi:hypothetical protein
MKPAIQAPRLVLWNIDQTPVEGGTVAGGLAGGAVELASSLYSGDDTLGGAAGGALSTSNSHHADHAEPSTAGCPQNTHGIHGLCLPRAPPSVDQRRAGPGAPRSSPGHVPGLTTRVLTRAERNPRAGGRIPALPGEHALQVGLV